MRLCCAGRRVRPHAERKMEAVFAVPFYAEGKFSFPSRKDGPAFVRMRPARCGLPRRQSVPRAANCPALVTRARRAGPHQRCGKEGFPIAYIAQVLIWPPVRCAAPLHWPSGFDAAFRATVRPARSDAALAAGRGRTQSGKWKRFSRFPFMRMGDFPSHPGRDGPALARARSARCGLPRHQSMLRAANCPALVTRAWRAGPSPVGTARKDFRLRMFRLGCPCGAAGGAPRHRGRRPGKGGRKTAKCCFPAGRVGRNDQWPAFRFLRDQVAPRKGRASRNSNVTLS